MFKKFCLALIGILMGVSAGFAEELNSASSALEALRQGAQATATPPAETPATQGAAVVLDSGQSAPPLPALSDDEVLAKAEALGKFLKDTHEKAAGSTIVGVDAAGVRRFGTLFQTKTEDSSILTPAGNFMRQVTTLMGEPVAALDIGTHAMRYALTLIDPRTGDIYFADGFGLNSLVGPVRPPAPARLIGALTLAQMDLIFAKLNMIILGQDHV